MVDQLNKETTKWQATMGWWPGAKKSGNADGVKAATAINRAEANTRYTQR